MYIEKKESKNSLEEYKILKSHLYSLYSYNLIIDIEIFD